MNARFYMHSPIIQLQRKTVENGTYIPDTKICKNIRQKHPDRDITREYTSLICMDMICPATCWFDNIQVPYYNLNEFKSGNKYYIYKPLLVTSIP